MQISVYSQSKNAVITVNVSSELEKLARAVAGDNVKSVCRAVFAIPHLREELVSRVTRTIDDECAFLCTKRVELMSLFRSMSLRQAECFLWAQAIAELESKAPTLYTILNSIVTHSASRNKFKKGESQYPGICMAVAILLKERNKQMCGLQSYLSSVLFSTKLHKKVCSH